MVTIPFHEQAAAVDKAAAHSVALIRSFAAMDPRDSDNNAWKHPELILKELDQARTQLAKAWKALQQAIDDDDQAQDASISEDDLRASYIDMITDSFADVLEEMRQKETDLDIEILADCLQSGLELMTQDDKDLFMECSADASYFEGHEQDQDGEEYLTPHERRRREQGYHIETKA
jgi:hypothetical protein